MVRVLGSTSAEDVSELVLVSREIAESVCETGADPGMSHYRPIPRLVVFGKCKYGVSSYSLQSAGINWAYTVLG